MDIRYCHGPVGMNTRESGLAGLTCRSELVSESVSSAALAGGGLIGDSIGITTIQFITTIGTTPGAGRSTTGAISTGELRLRVVAFVQERRRGLSQPQAGQGVCSIVPAERRGPSRGVDQLPGDMLHPAGKAESTPALSATTTMAERQEPIRRAEAPASVAGERMVVEGMAAGTTDPGSLNRLGEFWQCRNEEK